MIWPSCSYWGMRKIFIMAMEYEVRWTLMSFRNNSFLCIKIKSLWFRLWSKIQEFVRKLDHVKHQLVPSLTEFVLVLFYAIYCVLFSTKSAHFRPHICTSWEQKYVLLQWSSISVLSDVSILFLDFIRVTQCTEFIGRVCLLFELGRDLSC